MIEVGQAGRSNSKALEPTYVPKTVITDFRGTTSLTRYCCQSQIHFLGVGIILESATCVVAIYEKEVLPRTAFSGPGLQPCIGLSSCLKLAFWALRPRMSADHGKQRQRCQRTPSLSWLARLSLLSLSRRTPHWLSCWPSEPLHAREACNKRKAKRPQEVGNGRLPLATPLAFDRSRSFPLHIS
jgi:hypothetical protein